MKGFIEVTNAVNNETVLLNTSHIVEVIKNAIVTDNTTYIDTEYDCIECVENYGEIKRKIAYATDSK